MAVPKTSCVVYETPNCDFPCQERKGVSVCGHTCGQKPPKPQPCKIYLPPKPNPGIFDDLRHLNILKLIGDLLTFLLVFLFLLTLLELIIFHFITSHGAFKMPENIPPKTVPRIQQKPEKETEDRHHVEERPTPPPRHPHYVPETEYEPRVPETEVEPRVPLVPNQEYVWETQNTHEVRKEQISEVVRETQNTHEVRKEQISDEQDEHEVRDYYEYTDDEQVYPHPDEPPDNPHPAPVPSNPNPAPVPEKQRPAKCEPPCQNGGTCRVDSRTGASTCVCPPGKGGASCQLIICQPPCQNGGLCIVNPTNPHGRNLCLCPDGTQGEVCQDVEVPQEIEEVEPPTIVTTIITGDAFHKKNLRLPKYDKPKPKSKLGIPKIDKPETKWTLGIPKIAAQPEVSPSGQEVPQMKFPERETRKTGMKFPEAALPPKVEVKKETAECEKEPDEPYFKKLIWG